ncbi:MAG: hypothetical protein KJP22_07415 [Acidimicrobiia bacterium]|nr:hypothetical protein [Acidimicrobiia bacterium]
MAHRTALLVVVSALALLVASFSLQSTIAYAHDTDEHSIAEIYAIKDAALADIDGVVAATTAAMAAATSEPEAAGLRDAAVTDINGIAWTAGEDMWWVAVQSGGSGPVHDAFGDAAGLLDWTVTEATGEIVALYDGWVAENSGPTSEEVVAAIDQKLNNGLNKIDAILTEFDDELEDADNDSEAAQARTEALAALDDRVAKTLTRLNTQLELLPEDPAVQAAYDSAVDELNETADAAASTINSQYEQWVDGQAPPPPLPTTTTLLPTTTTTIVVPPTTTVIVTTTTVTLPPATITTTTTTTVPPTTTTTSTVPPTTTTTTVPPTTTTTLAPAALLPDLPPPTDQTSFMAKMPDPVVLSSTAASAPQENENDAMAAVALVRRVVESQLPAGVSTVAVGPLVVLGLVFDAIRAAGALMAVPWLILGAYMVGLLRQRTHGLTAAAPDTA